MQLKLLNTKWCTLFNFLQHHWPRMNWKHKGFKHTFVSTNRHQKLSTIPSTLRAWARPRHRPAWRWRRPVRRPLRRWRWSAESRWSLPNPPWHRAWLGSSCDSPKPGRNNFKNFLKRLKIESWKWVKRSNFRRSKQEIETITLQNWSGDRTIVDFLSFLQNWSGDRKGHSGPRFFLF